MAYTRGQHVQHMDDGEIETVSRPVAPVVAHKRPEAYICNKATIERNMEAFELFLLLDMLTVPIAVEIGSEEFGKLSPDLRRHFRPVSG